MPNELVPGVPYPTGSIPYLFNCSGTSDPSGGGCAVGFTPSLSVTLPSVGLPQVSLTLPDFSGMTIEGILKALELIGISPCSFIQAVAGGVTNMMSDLEFALQNSINQIADLPADIINGIANEAQAGIDGMANGLDFSGFDCEGLVGAANQAAADIAGLETDMITLQDQVNSLDSDVNNP